jgi:hypothetical protein
MTPRRLFRSSLGVLTLSVASVVPAAIVQGSGTVTVIISNLNYGNGDFLFRASSMPGGCTGYWMSPNQPGFKASVAFVLQARATGEPVLVGADTAQLWSGSGDQWCKVDYVGTPY